MRWLLEHRSDLGSNGWDSLLGEGKMRFATIKVNHFSMMRQPIVSTFLPLFISMISMITGVLLSTGEGIGGFD